MDVRREVERKKERVLTHIHTYRKNGKIYDRSYCNRKYQDRARQTASAHLIRNADCYQKQNKIAPTRSFCRNKL